MPMGVGKKVGVGVNVINVGVSSVGVTRNLGVDMKRRRKKGIRVGVAEFIPVGDVVTREDPPDPLCAVMSVPKNEVTTGNNVPSFSPVRGTGLALAAPFPTMIAMINRAHTRMGITIHMNALRLSTRVFFQRSSWGSWL